MTTMKTNQDIWKRIARGAVALTAAMGAAAVMAVNDLPGGPAVNELNLQPAATRIAAEIEWLHSFLLVICVVIFIAVFGVMFYSIVRHRKSVGHKSANFHESVAVEIAWTVVPFIIVTVMGLAATKTVVAMKDTSGADLTIKVTGYQWKWGYDYLNGEGAGIAILSTLDQAQRNASDAGTPIGDDYLLKVDHPLVVPVGQKVRVITTAADVIHSWGVPAFAVKQDAVPGFVRDAWFRAERTGDFYGQCVELCGKEHAYMPIQVKVLSKADYSQWAAGELKKLAALADDPAKVWDLPELVARGEKVYNTNCSICHRPDGKGAGPIKPLDASAIVLDADKSKQIDVVLNGRLNGTMPSWKALSDTDLAAVITFTKNNWSNKTGQIVQPADLIAARK
jgi:cytochrome c oxidase subunit 2